MTGWAAPHPGVPGAEGSIQPQNSRRLRCPRAMVTGDTPDRGTHRLPGLAVLAALALGSVLALVGTDNPESPRGHTQLPNPNTNSRGGRDTHPGAHFTGGSGVAWKPNGALEQSEELPEGTADTPSEPPRSPRGPRVMGGQTRHSRGCPWARRRRGALSLPVVPRPRQLRLLPSPLALLAGPAAQGGVSGTRGGQRRKAGVSGQRGQPGDNWGTRTVSPPSLTLTPGSPWIPGAPDSPGSP